VSLQHYQEQLFYFFTDEVRSFRVRDEGMAIVAQAIRKLRGPKEKAVLWAHNAHIGKNRAYDLDSMRI
jgi:erythromycin esterase-like protein